MSRLPVMLTMLLMLVSAASTAPPEGVNLADLAGWDIVVSADAIPSEVYAAEEFQRHLQLAGGPKLIIVHNADRPDRHVFVGAGPAMRSSAAGFAVDGFGPEDLRIVVRDGLIVVAGGRPRGTLYGVYTFLEDYLGVRFLTHDHTHVPAMGARRIVGPVDRSFHPPLDFRWSFYAINNKHPDFAARLRNNACPGSPNNPYGEQWKGIETYGGKSPMHLVCHTLDRRLLPPKIYAAKHPEYYTLFRGKRWATLKPGEPGVHFKRGEFPYGMQPCLTHPDVLRIVTKAVLDEFAAHPKVAMVSVAQNDGGAHCQCPTCAAIDKREGTPAGSLLTFVNAVADEVARKYPGKLVGTLAYSDTAAPPKTLRPRDNVLIQWCSIGTCFLHRFNDPACRQNIWFLKQIRRWGKISKHLYVWNYYANFGECCYQLPLPNLRWIGPNIRFLLSHGVKGMFMQATGSSYGNELGELRNYLLSNLMWDPSRDGGKLMNEWLDLHYGRAAPPIRRWIDRLHDRAIASGKHCRCVGGRYRDYGLDDSDVRAGLDAFEEATRLADSQAVRLRVEKASLWAYRAALEPVWYAKEDAKIEPAVAERLRPLARRFFELCWKYGVERTTEGSHNTIKKVRERLKRLLGL